MSTKDRRQAVLVLGDDTRSFLSVVRSFGRRGCLVDVCPFDFSSPALCSTYIRRVFHLPVYHFDPGRWVSELRKIVADGAYDFIIPCDDRSILPIHRHLDGFGGAPFALPNEDAIRIFYDKFETRQLAQACGVPIATGRLLTDSDMASDLAEEFGFPLVIKPRSSYVIANVGMRNNVRIVHDMSALREALAAEPDVSACLVEGWRPGHGVGVSVLADHGRLVQAFEYHRVHEPRSGGGSSYRVSKPLDPVLVDYVEKMLVGSRLNGVAMFEFRRDPDTGNIILLEVNARFWGGLPLAISAGVDFPWLLYRQSVLKEAVKASRYRTGDYARNISADFYTIVETAQMLSRESRVRATAFLLGIILKSTLRLVLFKESNDSFSWSDMSPFKAECGRIISNLALKLGRLAGLSPRRKAGRSRAAVRSLLERIEGRRPRVLFLCYGNICRSPFAERYLRSRAGDEIEVLSSGVHPEVERASPADAVTCAREWGVDDLESHRSTHISRHADAPVDLVVLFDEKNLTDLHASGFFPNVLAVKLGVFPDDADAGADIEDPYGHGPDRYQFIYGRVAAAVDGLLLMARQVRKDRTG